MTVAQSELAAMREPNLSLAEKVEYAKLLANSGMIPKHYQKNPANCLVALEYGEALGIPGIVAINQITVVNGGASMEAKLMAALIRKAGHKIRVQRDPERVAVTIIRIDDPVESTVVWDKAKAQAHGLWGGGHWKKNPQLMLEYRAISEAARLICPEVLAGISYTPEEMEELGALHQRTITVTQVDLPTQSHEPRTEKTASHYMRAIGLTGAQFKAFAERVLGVHLKSWEALDADDQQSVLTQLDEWERTGTDPTILDTEASDIPEGVDPETGEITGGAR